MSRLLVTALGMVVALGIASTALAQTAAEKGMKVYTEQKCSLCHSIDGKGNAKGALDGVATKLKETEIREWITDPKAMTTKMKAERKPAMKEYKTLAKADVDAVVAYMMTLKKK